VLNTQGSGGGTGRTWRPPATLMTLAAVLCIGLGAWWSQPAWNAGVPFALQEAGAVVFPAGALMLGLAVRAIIRARRRKRTW
jgi:hypothetical protein